MITLYHGSDVEIAQIDLSLGQPDKDFGKGFYLTDIKAQAERMALSRCQRNGSTTPTITTFSFNESLLRSRKLKVKIFAKPTEAWARFVVNNRHASQTGFTHSYDIVIGPVADDNVAYQLRRFEEGAISLRRLVNGLTYRRLNSQYFFATEPAVKELTKITFFTI